MSLLQLDRKRNTEFDFIGGHNIDLAEHPGRPPGRRNC